MTLPSAIPAPPAPRAPAALPKVPVPSPQASAQEALAKAQANSDAAQHDYQLAVNKGASPEHLAARRRVARTFCEIHFPKEAPEALQGRLDAIDYTQVLAVVNVRGVDIENPKRTGFLGMGRKPAYYVGTAFPPRQPEDPTYALEYYPLKH